MFSKRAVVTVLASGLMVATVGVAGASTALADGEDTPPEVVEQIESQDWPEYSHGDDPAIDIFAAKHVLHYLGYPPGELNNEFDDETLEAVLAFQDEHDVDEDGDLGQETWDTLNEESFAQEPFGPGSRGHMVMMIQRVLNAKYQLDIAVDGEYGPETEGAVEWVQEEHDIGADGWFGELTFRAVVTYQDYDT